MRTFRLAGAAALLLFQATHADVRNCLCDVERPQTLAARECSLCKAAEEQPGGTEFFTLRDANPNKAHRWLSLPRRHGRNPQDLADMTPQERAAYWSFSIAKAHELFGDDWGLAVNSLERRTQCHMHIHIGRLRDGVEDDSFVVVAGAAAIPVPRDGDGLLVHLAGGKLHVHTGNDAPELMLER